MGEMPSQPALGVSLGICTRNRAAMLRTALAQLCKLHVPAGVTLEVLLVDNGSSDETPNRPETNAADRRRRGLPSAIIQCG